MLTKKHDDARRTLRAVAVSAIILGTCAIPTLVQAAEPVEQPNVKLILDWLFDGAHSPIMVADAKGYFKAEGLTVQIDAGTGSGSAVANVASGVYQFAVADVPTMVQFDGRNPGKIVTAFYMMFDQTPLAVMTLRSKNIKTPADMDGKKITGRAGQAAFEIMPVLLEKAHAQNTKIDWKNVSPQIEAPMFVRGDVDGMAGFSITQSIAAVELGTKMDDIHIIKFADFGVDLYGLGFMASKSFIEANPKTVKAFARAINRALKDALADPKGTIDILKSRAPLIKPDSELLRFTLSRDLILTPNIKEHGLSAVTPARMQATIDTISSVDKSAKKPLLADVWTDQFLPPASERKVQ
jgi:NitT/TauT family transport system substrate-binding protein